MLQLALPFQSTDLELMTTGRALRMVRLLAPHLASSSAPRSVPASAMALAGVTNTWALRWASATGMALRMEPRTAQPRVQAWAPRRVPSSATTSAQAKVLGMAIPSVLSSVPTWVVATSRSAEPLASLMGTEWKRAQRSAPLSVRLLAHR